MPVPNLCAGMSKSGCSLIRDRGRFDAPVARLPYTKTRGTCRRARSAGGDCHGTPVGRHCRLSRRPRGPLRCLKCLAQTRRPCSGPPETGGTAALAVARFVKRVPDIGPAPAPKAGPGGTEPGEWKPAGPARTRRLGPPMPAGHGDVDAGSSVAGPQLPDGRGGQPDHPTTGPEAPAPSPGPAARAVRSPRAGSEVRSGVLCGGRARLGRIVRFAVGKHRRRLPAGSTRYRRGPAGQARVPGFDPVPRTSMSGDGARFRVYHIVDRYCCGQGMDCDTNPSAFAIAL